MAGSLGSLVISLAANTAQLSSDLGKAQQQITRFTNQVNAGLKTLGAGISVAGIGYFVKSVIDAGDRLNDLRTRTGLTGQQLIELQGAAVRAGGSIDTVGSVTSKLSSLLVDAARGTGDAAEAYAAMGIKVTRSGGSLKSVDQILREVAAKMKTYEDGTDKAALASAALGKAMHGIGGDKLIPMLEALDETTERFRRLGITIDERFITAADRFNDKLEDMKSLAQATGRDLVASLLPALEKLVDLMIALRTNSEVLSSAGNGLRIFLETVAVLASDVAFVFERLGEAIGATGAQIAAVMRGDFRQVLQIRDEYHRISAEERKKLDEFQARVLDRGPLARLTPSAGDFPVPGSGRRKAPALPDLAALKAAADEFQKYLQARTKNELDEFKDLLAHKQAMLDLAYQDNRLSDENYFRAKLTLAKDSAEEEIKAVDALRDAQYAALYKAKFDTKEYWAALKEVEETEAKRAKIIREFGQLTELSFEQARAAAEKYRRSIEDVNTQILELTGNTVGAAGARFDAQFRDLRRKASAEGDTAGVASIDRLRELTMAQADFNRLREDATAVTTRLAIEEERIQNSQRTSAISEFEALQRTGAARVQAAAQLDAIVGGLERVAAASQNPALVLQAEQARAALEKLRSESDLLGEKFESIFSGAAAEAFTDFINGTKSASEAFKSFANSVVNAINRMVAEALAKKLWQVITGGSGAGGGVASFFSNLLGGGGSGPLSNLTPSVGDFPLGGFAGGTDYVPRTGTYRLHQGEAVLPAAENMGGRSVHQTLNFYVQGTLDDRSTSQIEVATLRSARRSLARHG